MKFGELMKKSSIKHLMTRCVPLNCGLGPPGPVDLAVKDNNLDPLVAATLRRVSIWRRPKSCEADA